MPHIYTLYITILDEYLYKIVSLKVAKVNPRTNDLQALQILSASS